MKYERSSASGNELTSVFASEYRKHLKNNLFPALWFCLVYVAVCLLLYGLTALIRPYILSTKAIKQIDVQKVVESDQRYSEYSVMYKLENLCTVMTDSNARLNVFVYVQAADQSALVQEYTLAENEIAVSEKVSECLHVKQGDIIRLELPVYNEAQKYEVVSILPYTADYYNVGDSMDFSVVCLGRNNTLIDHMNGKYVYFLDDNEYDSFMKHEYSYRTVHDSGTDVGFLTGRADVLSTLVSVLWTCAMLVYAFIMNRMVTEETLKFYRDTYSPTIVKKIYLADCLLSISLPSGIGLALLLTAILMNRMTAVYVLVYILGLFVTVFSVVRGGKKFEKAD